MKKYLRLIIIIMVILASMVSSGCSILFKKPEEKKEPPKIETPLTSPAEEQKVKDTLQEYFKALYAQPVDSYVQNIVTGNIPANISGLIAKRTIDEGNNNPEVGIYPPRIVDMNGLNLVSYEVINGADSKPKIDVNFIGNSGDTFIYFVKVDLKAKGLYDTDFIKYYVENPLTRACERINGINAPINELELDIIKVQAKYDVEVLKDGDQYKVLTQKEVNRKPGVQNRLFKLNNEFMVRLPYLDKDNAEEKKIYTSESELLKGFFENLIKLDKDRVSLLKNKWQIDQTNFITLAGTMGINKVKDKEVLLIDGSYKNKFNFESFPLKTGMKQFIGFKSFETIVHPGYTQKNKKYVVNFNASVIKDNGMIEDEVIYKYSYTVNLNNVNESVMIESFNLDEYTENKDFKPQGNSQEESKQDANKEESKDKPKE